MDRYCSINACVEDPVAFCHCQSPCSYFCKEHLDLHLLMCENKDAELVNLELKGGVRKEFRSVLEKSKQKYEQLRAFYREVSKNIIDDVVAQSSKSMEAIRKAEENLSKFAKKVTAEGIIQRKAFEYLKSSSVFEVPDCRKSFDSLLTDCASLFDMSFFAVEPVPPSLNQSFLMFFDENNFGLFKIDLEAFECTVKRLPEEFKSTYFNSGCLLDTDCSFFNGGKQNRSSSAASGLYNPHLNKFVHLPKSNFIRESAACVYKAGKVFVFGEGATSLGSCEAFNLESSKWQVLPNLPQHITYCSGSLVGSKILLSGLNASSLWEFQEKTSKYVLHYSMLPKGYKTVSGNFIVTCDGLFEIYENEGKLELTKYEYMWLGSPLIVNMALRVKDGIFFVDARKKLMKICMGSKKVEEIKYSVKW